MALHLEYRPQDFDEVFGNEEVVKAIEAKLNFDDLPHTWLFTGPSGCGKTTMARILSRQLGCSGPPALQELNISDARGIDAARKIISTANYMPLAGGTSVYILDEIQEATGNFQNAILKALEDSPNHVFFILCTTDPDKLLKTIRSRCSTWEMKPLNRMEMRSLLEWVLESEEKQVSKAVLNQVAVTSEGRPREALVMLDQVIDLEKEEALATLDRAVVREREVKELCKKLLDHGAAWKSVTSVLEDIKDKDPEKVRRAVLGYMESVLRGGKINPRAVHIMECFLDPFFHSGSAGLVLSCAQVFEDDIPF